MPSFSPDKGPNNSQRAVPIRHPTPPVASPAIPNNNDISGSYPSVAADKALIELLNLAKESSCSLYVKVAVDGGLVYQLLQGEMHLQNRESAARNSDIRRTFAAVMLERMNPGKSIINKAIVSTLAPYAFALRILPKLFRISLSESGISESYKEAASREQYIVELGNGYKWRLYEQFYLFGLGLFSWSLTSGVLNLLTFKKFDPVLSDTSSIFSKISINAFLLSYGLLALDYVRRKYNKLPAPQTKFGAEDILSLPFLPLHIGQDQAMAESIENFWRNNENIQNRKAIAVMGGMHLKGVGSWLEHLGWKKVQ